MKNKIAVLGGDLRQYTAALALCQKGWAVNLWGFNEKEEKETELRFCESYKEALDGVIGVVFPLPTSTDGVFLNCPFSTSYEKPRLSDIFPCIDECDIIIGGKIPTEFIKTAESKGFKVRDYFESEEFQIQNSYITAEAALSIAMNSLDKNICGSKIAVTGYGRIAKHLVKLLRGLGADVTVAARKSSDLAWGYCSGCSVLRLGDSSELKNNIYKLAHGYDIIYNTVPHWLFDRSFLENSDKKTFIIDLASVPGGVDIRAAKELGSNVLWAASLPGKYAPLSAGNLIASCVDDILHGEVREC